jgi:uncharacterized protein
MNAYQQNPFWRNKSLDDMSHEEWESLCDGCGKCCMIRLQDEDTGKIADTNIACKLFERTACTCSDYANRCTRVPDCVSLTPDNLGSLDWMPKTCAYRLIFEGFDLPPWHPLITGSRESIHLAGMSVRDKTVCETEIDPDDVENYALEWPGER